MKFNLIFLFLITLFSCNTNEKNLEKSELDKFDDIQIKYITGDEVMTFHKMSIIKEGQKIKAIKERPFYYYGSQTDSTWTTDIGKSELQLIKKFITKALTQKDTCPFSSTSIDHYDIKIANTEKINIIGNCEWDGTNYYSLEKKIFEHNFIELENKRNVVSDSIVNSFIGSWSVTGLENGFISRTKVILKRIDKTYQSSIEPKVWSFNNSFKNQMKDDVDVDGGGSYIDIRGSRYKIIEIKTDTIELVYLYS